MRIFRFFRCSYVLYIILWLFANIVIGKEKKEIQIIARTQNAWEKLISTRREREKERRGREERGRERERGDKIARENCFN